MKVRGASPRSVRRSARNSKVASRRPKPKLFPVVGVGVSAGDLGAVSKFLCKVPPDLGMALVVVPHPDLQNASICVSRLCRSTSMPVHEVTGRTSIEANHVYVIPHNTKAQLQDSMLCLTR